MIAESEEHVARGKMSVWPGRVAPGIDTQVNDYFILYQVVS